MKSVQETIKIFTDGACKGNPGPGGWAAIIDSGKSEKVLSGSEKETTNNRMELTAALESLKALPRNGKAILYTDSEYLRKGVTDWMAGWKARNWRRKEGALANADLWKAIDNQLNDHEVTWEWVKGHNGHKQNERVDKLARLAIPK
ncbi:MAG: ribonuclease HI [Anaerolineaceae bacterium]|nr:ribonuclease HI [Anaerolineaceae bacterium]